MTSTCLLASVTFGTCQWGSSAFRVLLSRRAAAAVRHHPLGPPLSVNTPSLAPPPPPDCATSSIFAIRDCPSLEQAEQGGILTKHPPRRSVRLRFTSSSQDNAIPRPPLTSTPRTFNRHSKRYVAFVIAPRRQRAAAVDRQDVDGKHHQSGCEVQAAEQD